MLTLILSLSKDHPELVEGLRLAKDEARAGSPPELRPSRPFDPEHVATGDGKKGNDCRGEAIKMRIKGKVVRLGVAALTLAALAGGSVAYSSPASAQAPASGPGARC